MKKLTLTLLSAALATTLFAQSQFVATPVTLDGQTLMFQGVNLSDNHNYVAGKDAYTGEPALWNTTTQQFVLINELVQTAEGDMPKTGSFNGINNSGIAVGDITDPSTYINVPIMASITDNGTYTILYNTDQDAGGSAWDISADGSTIVGFHFDADWTTHACIWTNNGQTRTDLPVPTTEQMGMEIDYVSARWISADGSVVLGYAQNSNDGEWVALAWRKVGTTYEPVCFAQDYFKSSFDEDAAPVDGLYFTFEPSALSADGNWISLRVVASYDPNDWDYWPQDLTARYNLNTNSLEVLNSTLDFDAMTGFGISNSGSIVGRLTTEAQEERAFLWATSTSEATLITDLFPSDSYVLDQNQTSFASITSDDTYVMGYAVSNSGSMTTFVVALPSSAVGIDDVEGTHIAEPRIKGIYDLMGRKLETIPQHGIYIIDGKKVIR